MYVGFCHIKSIWSQNWSKNGSNILFILFWTPFHFNTIRRLKKNWYGNFLLNSEATKKQKPLCKYIVDGSNKEKLAFLAFTKTILTFKLSTSYLHLSCGSFRGERISYIAYNMDNRCKKGYYNFFILTRFFVNLSRYYKGGVPKGFPIKQLVIL